VTGAGVCLLTLLPLAIACHSARPGASAAADSCAAASGQLPPTATAEGLAGEYRLHLVTTAGRDSGASVPGRLELREQPDSLQQPPPMLGIRDTTTRYPLAGLAELDRDALGATNTGALASTDAAAPGVLLIERHPARPAAPAEIMLRLGADANRRGAVRYDGGYFALTVRRLDRAGFAGTWASGALGPSTAGYFCAERTGP
jgi:hypothetical protein